MIPFSSFGTNSISWNSEEDLFSVQYENATVKDILDYIEKHSKYIFIYSENVKKNLNNKVSISVSNKKIDAVLKELFSETGLNYKMSGRQITISIPEAPKVQQATQQKGIKVTGNVSDEKGEPLIGVTIILKNDSTVHSLTDMNGNYSITVPAKRSVLSFRYIGFVPKEEVVDNRKVVNVQMVEDVGQLDEVVVVAYGAQKKESVVGSITTIEPAKLKVSTSRSLSNNLAGTVAGVLAVQRSGEPGYDNSTFWIRGISTFQKVGGDPLVLVDGIERELNNIDPEELAMKLNISYSWFRKVFKDYTGYAPAKYFQELKLRKAKQLLVGTSQSVKEISFMLDYKSTEHFFSLFKKRTGFTPLEYRSFGRETGIVDEE